MTTPRYTSGLDWGVLIIVDGEARSPVTPVIPAHDDDPDPPRNLSYRASPTEIVYSWTPPLNWGNESNPTGTPRYYEIAYRRNTDPDDQTSEESGNSITIPARGAASITKFAIRSVNAAGRESRAVNAPEVDFDHSRRFGRQFGRQFG